LHFRRVAEIRLDSGSLAPEETLSMDMWVRGDDLPGFKQLNILFYYEPMDSEKPRYMRHGATIWEQ